MNKKLQITIPSPCHEKWQDMTPAEKGRFCASCQRVVHDFTRSSDREIASVLTKESNACGRFLSTQLDRDLVIHKEKSTMWMAASAAVVSFLSLGTNETIAQNPATEQLPSAEYGDMLGKVGPASSVITGGVYDEEGMPIPGVDIKVEGTNESAQTDLDGEYSIHGQKGQVLLISYDGFKTAKITIGSSTTIYITLKEENLKEELIIMGYRTTTPKVSNDAITTTISKEDIGDKVKKRTFFGRIFHSIGNRFRKND
jgi:hypothetical protein